MLTDAIFLRGSAMVMAGTGSVPFWLGRAAATTQGRSKILVAIFQRGAADGLNMVVPFAEKRYYELRPTIGVPAPRASNGPNPAIDLDGRFGAASRAATAEGAVGQAEAGDRGGHGVARPVPLALRRAGLHGIGHAGVERRRLVESRAASGAARTPPRCAQSR